MVQFGVGVKRTRQHRRLQYRDGVVFGNIPDFHGKQISPFRHHLRRPHGGFVVFDGDRKVGRVHQNEVGLGHGANAVALCNFALPLAQLALHLRVAVGFLVLLLHFLLRHLHLGFMQEGL